MLTEVPDVVAAVVVVSQRPHLRTRFPGPNSFPSCHASWYVATTHKVTFNSCCAILLSYHCKLVCAIRIRKKKRILHALASSALHPSRYVQGHVIYNTCFRVLGIMSCSVILACLSTVILVFLLLQWGGLPFSTLI